MGIYERWEGLKLVWVSPGSFNFSPEHLLWVLPMLNEIRSGYYPRDPAGDTGKGRGGTRLRCPFSEAAIIAAEIDRRLARCGLDRYIAEECYVGGISVSDLAGKLYMDEFEISRRLAAVVSYVASGPCARFQACERCIYSVLTVSISFVIFFVSSIVARFFAFSSTYF